MWRLRLPCELVWWETERVSSRVPGREGWELEDSGPESLEGPSGQDPRSEGPRGVWSEQPRLNDQDRWSGEEPRVLNSRRHCS